MFIQENFVEKAVAKAGGPTMTSNQLGVSNGAVHKWIKANRVPNLNTAKRLAELSHVSLEKLRPE